MTASPTDSIVGASSDKKEELPEIPKFTTFNWLGLLVCIGLILNFSIVMVLSGLEDYSFPPIYVWLSVAGMCAGGVGLLWTLEVRDTRKSFIPAPEWKQFRVSQIRSVFQRDWRCPKCRTTILTAWDTSRVWLADGTEVHQLCYKTYYECDRCNEIYVPK